MTKKIYYSVLVLLAIVLSLDVSAQDKIVQGVITTFESIPVIDAQISVKSTKQEVFTDSLGRFTVPTNTKDVLTVFANGFYKERVKIKDNIRYAAVNLRLKPGEKNKFYAVGYGHVSDKDKLNALSSLNSDESDFTQYSNVFDIIKGKFAGVTVTNNQIFIRGATSIYGDNTALIVIDGIVTDNTALATLSPTVIKSIDVIKDGGAAIYGVRGANGVVVVETKKAND